MIKICKEEAQMLREKKYGNMVHISSKAHQDRKRYWATETPAVLKLIEKYRKNLIIS